MGSNPFRDRECRWGDPPRPGECDPYRFLEVALFELLRSNVRYGEAVKDIPWAPVEKSLSQSRISVVSTAGLSMKGDTRFDMETERRRPTWGDPTWRRLQRDVTAETLQADHLHIETSHVLADPDVCFPVPLLRELEREETIGEAAPSHYSIMGFQGPDLRRLEPSCTAIAEAMVSEEVDLALLVPV
ncbi:hypothetical protein MK489_18605 [Myxococcota bacterium]|nr:hypothetical protein [Myxococcota bacterium]